MILVGGAGLARHRPVPAQVPDGAVVLEDVGHQVRLGRTDHPLPTLVEAGFVQHMTRAVTDFEDGDRRVLDAAGGERAIAHRVVE